MDSIGEEIEVIDFWCILAEVTSFLKTSLD